MRKRAIRWPWLAVMMIVSGCAGPKPAPFAALSVERKTMTLPPDRLTHIWTLTNRTAEPYAIEGALFNGEVRGAFGYFHAGMYETARTGPGTMIPPHASICLTRADGPLGDEETVWFIEIIAKDGTHTWDDHGGYWRVP